MGFHGQLQKPRETKRFQQKSFSPAGPVHRPIPPPRGAGVTQSLLRVPNMGVFQGFRGFSRVWGAPQEKRRYGSFLRKGGYFPAIKGVSWGVICRIPW